MKNTYETHVVWIKTLHLGLVPIKCTNIEIKHIK